MGQNQVVAIALPAGVSNLFELDHKVCRLLPDSFVTLAGKRKLSFFAKSRVDLNLLAALNLLDRAGVMLNLRLSVFDSLVGAHVEFSQGALNNHYDVLDLGVIDPSLAVVAVSKHASSQIASVQVTRFRPRVAGVVDLVKNGIRVFGHEVASSVAHALGINNSFFKAEFSVFVINGSQMHCSRLW